MEKSAYYIVEAVIEREDGTTYIQNMGTYYIEEKKLGNLVNLTKQLIKEFKKNFLGESYYIQKLRYYKIGE